MTLSQEELVDHLKRFGRLAEEELQRLLEHFIKTHGETSCGYNTFLTYTGPATAVRALYKQPAADDAQRHPWPPSRQRARRAGQR